MKTRNLILPICICLLAFATGASAFDGAAATESGSRSAGNRATIETALRSPAGTEGAGEDFPPAPGHAAAPSGASPFIEAHSPHSFEVAPLVMRFEYEEPSYMSEEGFLFGLAGRYRFVRGVIMAEAGVELAAGSLDYDGSYWDGTALSSDSDDYLLGLRGLFGANIPAGAVTITPFAGFGLRYWNDTIQAPGGYEREITYLYSPLGLRLAGPLAPGWSWSLSGEYDFFWQGWVISHLSDVNPWYNDPENNQDTGSGYGLRFAFQLRNRVSDNFAWYIEPFFRYWDVEQSDYAILENYPSPGQYRYVYEPDNHTTSYGASVGLAF